MGRFAGGGGEVTKKKLSKKKLTEAEAKVKIAAINKQGQAFLAEVREYVRACKKWRKDLYKVMREMVRELGK